MQIFQFSRIFAFPYYTPSRLCVLGFFKFYLCFFYSYLSSPHTEFFFPAPLRFLPNTRVFVCWLSASPFGKQPLSSPVWFRVVAFLHQSSCGFLSVCNLPVLTGHFGHRLPHGWGRRRSVAALGRAFGTFSVSYLQQFWCGSEFAVECSFC